jgi:hypothetical protein
MRCPECYGLNEADAAFCSSCGLILIRPPPGTRSAGGEHAEAGAENHAAQHHRATDQATYRCRFCGGTSRATAIRCRHSSEIVDDHYYGERANRLRARVNYPSWVTYLFGLAALLVFRPVGSCRLRRGLLLSIAYSAMPVAPPMSSSSAKQVSLGGAAALAGADRRPHFAVKNKKLSFVGTPLLAALIGYGPNVILLQPPVDDVLK